MSRKGSIGIVTHELYFAGRVSVGKGIMHWVLDLKKGIIGYQMCHYSFAIRAKHKKGFGGIKKGCLFDRHAHDLSPHPAGGRGA